jgi:hypothetical protein
VKTILWILGLAGGWAALTLAMNLPRERRLRRLAKARADGSPFSAFREALPDVPEGVLREVYRGVQGLVPGESFPIRADDDLLGTLEVDQGSLGDLIEELLPKPQEPGTWRDLDHPVTTVGDLARLTWQHRQRGGQ